MIDRDILLVVPCFNEENRFNSNYFKELLNHSNLRILFVNDGSTDQTQYVIENFVDISEGKASLLNLPRNIGKANAVRGGFLSAFNSNFSRIGFLDADGAFPSEIVLGALHLIGTENFNLNSLWFSRVKLAGSKIERNWMRHYVGRIIATIATYGIPNCPYDTQAGFKLFVNDEDTKKIWEKPFTTKWLFDIEIILRLDELNLSDAIREIPVQAWRDVKGSKINAMTAISILIEMLKILKLKRSYLKDHTR